jgi:A/G-specific adenine glycosylase
MPLQQKLLHWFAKEQRLLPWRRHYRPYEVWVSEIMLQQTQMDTVLPYYERWMKRFPTLASLAESEEKDVLKHWEGLGYYSRARNIHRSAKEVVENHGGRFPESFEAILALKGVGRYTAGAIASIAFNQDKPIVDGNVLRVLSRVYAIGKPIDIEANREEFWKLQEKLIPAGKARYFNQAMMELGALVCTTQNPACALCPIRSHCQAYKTGTQEDYPVKAKKKRCVKIGASALVLKKNGKFLIRLRPVGKIMGGLWEFPEWKLSRDKQLSIEDKMKKTRKLSSAEFGTNGITLNHAGRIKRNYTHHLEDLDVFTADVEHDIKPSTQWEHFWAEPKDFKSHPFSSAHAKIIKLLR